VIFAGSTTNSPTSSFLEQYLLFFYSEIETILYRETLYASWVFTFEEIQKSDVRRKGKNLYFAISSKLKIKKLFSAQNQSRLNTGYVGEQVFQ